MRGTGAQSRLSLPWEPRPRHSRGRGEGLAGLEEGGQAAGAGEGPPGEPGWEGLPPPALSRKPPSASSANSQIIKPIYFSDKKKKLLVLQLVPISTVFPSHAQLFGAHWLQQLPGRPGSPASLTVPAVSEWEVFPPEGTPFGS